MCTVTYLPFNQREFILTSNRDEDIERPAALPFKEYKVHGRSVFFPKDPRANGTWIAYDVKGYTLCLLNGASEKHSVKTTYKKSRGLVLLDFYNYNEPGNFASQYDFKGIEPFTLIMAYSCSDTDKVRLYELKWDEIKSSLIKHDSALPQIWSSVTLYDEETIKARRAWFDTWLSKHDNYKADDILFFHHFAGTGDKENDLLLNRGQKQTVSISCITKQLSHTDIIYEDLINKKLVKNKIINC
jgi:hypothetical protein